MCIINSERGTGREQRKCDNSSTINLKGDQGIGQNQRLWFPATPESHILSLAAKCSPVCHFRLGKQQVYQIYFTDNIRLPQLEAQRTRKTKTKLKEAKMHHKAQGKRSQVIIIFLFVTLSDTSHILYVI